MLSSIYTKKYFLSDCEGYRQYISSKGEVLSPRLKKIFKFANILPEMRVLDIGCGRGELILHTANFNAMGVGIDFSAQALGIAKDALLKKAPQIKNNVCFIKADCSFLPFREDTFDIIFLSDIVEHLTPKDLDKTLSCVHKIIKPQGKIILHSSPNRIFVRYGLKLYNLLGKLYKKNLDWDMVSNLPCGCQKEIHVNEQTIFSLKKLFRKIGFKKINLWLEKNPHYIYYFFNDDSFVRKINLLYKIFPIKHLFFSDIYGVISR